MKKVSSIAALAGIFAVVAASPAVAVPIRATFNGSVSGALFPYNTVLSDYAIGTNASFDVIFDTDLAPSVPLGDFGLAPVSGSVQLGADQWILDAGNIVGYSANPLPSYTMQFTGAGPANHAGGSFFGLFLDLTPALNPVANDPFAVGFRYPVGSGGAAYFSYATLSGTFDLVRTTSVPEPGTALLLLSAVALLWCFRRRGASLDTANFYLIRRDNRPR